MKWQRVRTQDGWHLRFVASNGETIVWSETYDAPGEVERALHLVKQSLPEGAFAADAILEEVDER